MQINEITSGNKLHASKCMLTGLISKKKIRLLSRSAGLGFLNRNKISISHIQVSRRVYGGEEHNYRKHRSVFIPSGYINEQGPCSGARQAETLERDEEQRKMWIKTTIYMHVWECVTSSQSYHGNNLHTAGCRTRPTTKSFLNCAITWPCFGIRVRHLKPYRGNGYNGNCETNIWRFHNGQHNANKANIIRLMSSPSFLVFLIYFFF